MMGGDKEDRRCPGLGRSSDLLPVLACDVGVIPPRCASSRQVHICVMIKQTLPFHIPVVTLTISGARISVTIIYQYSQLYTTGSF
jgi:hypothetical protein